MALLTAADLKALVPKAREISDSALGVYMDDAEARILRFLGGAATGEITRIVEFEHPETHLSLARPLLDGAKANVASISLVGEELEAIDAGSWYVIDPHTLYRSSCWPCGVLQVAYTPEGMEAAAKTAQAQLVALSLVSDGLASIEDGEYIERRTQGVGDSPDMIARRERQILGKLLRGRALVGGGGARPNYDYGRRS